MHATRRWLILGSLTVALLAGCASLLESERWERVVGIIEDTAPVADADPWWSPIQLPEIVQSGVPFTASVITLGSSSCTRADGADVEIAGLVAEITPYDLTARNAVCTSDLARHPRSVTLRFDSPGEAVIRVHGRTLLTDEPTLYEPRILVEP